MGSPTMMTVQVHDTVGGEPLATFDALCAALLDDIDRFDRDGTRLRFAATAADPFVNTSPSTPPDELFARRSFTLVAHTPAHTVSALRERLAATAAAHGAATLWIAADDDFVTRTGR